MFPRMLQVVELHGVDDIGLRALAVHLVQHTDATKLPVRAVCDQAACSFKKLLNMY